MAMDKLEGPSTTITYLGILIDPSDLTIQVPDDKRLEISSALWKWSTREKCTKRELLSLIGKLAFICKVIRPGRMFLRRLITLSTSVKQPHHHLSLNKEARADIKWWINNLPLLNRKSIILEPLTIHSTDLKLFTDASIIGYGAIFENSWIQEKWPPHFKHYSIDFKELFAIYAACITWGGKWQGKRMVFCTDNLPISQIWDTGSSKSPDLMSLIRKIYFLAAKLQFTISFKHIMGTFNPIADALSRFQVHRFQQLAPFADSIATTVPPIVWEA